MKHIIRSGTQFGPLPNPAGSWSTSYKRVRHEFNSQVAY